MNVLTPGCDGTEIPNKSSTTGQCLTCSSWVDDDLTYLDLEKADCTMFVATLCSGSSYGKLCTFAKYMAWVCPAPLKTVMYPDRQDVVSYLG